MRYWNCFFPLFFFSCLFSSNHIWQWIGALFQLDLLKFQADSSWEEHVFNLRGADRIRRGGFCPRLQLYSIDPNTWSWASVCGMGDESDHISYGTSNLDLYSLSCPNIKILSYWSIRPTKFKSVGQSIEAHGKLTWHVKQCDTCRALWNLLYVFPNSMFSVFIILDSIIM